MRVIIPFMSCEEAGGKDKRMCSKSINIDPESIFTLSKTFLEDYLDLNRYNDHDNDNVEILQHIMTGCIAILLYFDGSAKGGGVEGGGLSWEWLP